MIVNSVSLGFWLLLRLESNDSPIEVKAFYIFKPPWDLDRDYLCHSAVIRLPLSLNIIPLSNGEDQSSTPATSLSCRWISCDDSSSPCVRACGWKTKVYLPSLLVIHKVKGVTAQMKWGLDGRRPNVKDFFSFFFTQFTFCVQQFSTGSGEAMTGLVERTYMLFENPSNFLPKNE